jgi:hypothetical protein
MKLVDWLVKYMNVRSKTMAKYLIKAGAVDHLNSEYQFIRKMTDPNEEMGGIVVKT